VSLLSGNVLITGATGGIGQAIARAFAQRGATLALTGRRADVLEPLAAEVDGRALTCDLSDRQQVARLIQDLADTEFDVVVANAAHPGSGLVEEYSQEQIDQILEVNLRAPIAITRALAPGMMERGRGHFVFISSLSGKAASPASSLYSATKFGLRGFSLALRADLGAHGVGASVVLPGFIRDAGMFADAKIKLPLGVGTRSPDDVAAGVIRAIEHDRAEVEVAHAGLRLGSSFASVLPQTAARVSRVLGSEKIARELARGQVDKR
jgi:short-subunit dehydrogenase